MSGKYNWSSFQTLLLKYFKRKDFYFKEGTKTVRIAVWGRGNSDLEVKYYHSSKGETLKGITIICHEEHRDTVHYVDLKTYSFGFEKSENSPYIKWEINNGTGYRQVNFPLNDE